MNILVLETGLFPDGDSVEGAINALGQKEHAIDRVIIAGLPADDEDAWDMVVRKIMTARRVITI